MENNRSFNVSKIIGSKIYKFIDSDGNTGKVHFSKCAGTPTPIFEENSKCLVDVYGKKFEVSSLEELDAINNALNNSDKSLRKIVSTPSIVIAQHNPDLYIKVLEVIREKILIDAENTKRPVIKNKYNPYETIDVIQRKISKIEKTIATQKTETTELQPE